MCESNKLKLESKSRYMTLISQYYLGTSGDAMRISEGMAFTTKDSDNDKRLANCARRLAGAWWYRGCHQANLNGVYYQQNDLPTAFGQGLIWKQWKGYFYSLKKVTMKIRAI